MVSNNVSGMQGERELHGIKCSRQTNRGQIKDIKICNALLYLMDANAEEHPHQ